MLATIKSILNLILITTMFTGCIRDKFQDPNKNQNDKTKEPQGVIAPFVFDQSKSATFNQIPTIKTKTISDIFEILRSKSKGSEVCWININERKPDPLRIKLMPEQGEPEAIKAAVKQNQRVLEQALPIIYRSVQERNAPKTRLYECLQIAIFFLQEPHHPANSRKILFINSDLEEDFLPVEKRHPLRVPDGTVVVHIGAHPDSVRQILEAGRIFTYTDMAGFLDFLRLEVDDGKL